MSYRRARVVLETLSWVLAGVAVLGILWGMAAWVRQTRRADRDLDQEACSEECLRSGIYDTRAKCDWACQRWRP